MNCYRHFTIEERTCLRKHYTEGLSFAKLQNFQGVAPAQSRARLPRNYTNRYEYNTYYPHTAHKKYLFRRRFCHRGMFGNEKLVEYITEKLQATWSPEQIANTPCELKMPCHKTIYRWLYEGYVAKGILKVLRKKGKTRKDLGTAGDLPLVNLYGKGIKAYINVMNLGIGKQLRQFQGAAKQAACFATLAERKTRFYIAIKLPDRKGSTLAKAVITALSQLPKGAVKTITCDRGSEFANWREIESALNCQMYFADPYCAWQKGTNENLNGLLREFYPKGHNLSRVSPKTLEKKSGVN